tara:strand:- start:50 stop:430 length:381 start_codon:yes stop_codon:yes gene_type:complete
MARREYLHISLSGNTATELIEININKDLDIYSMTICNTHASDVVAIDLYLQKLDDGSEYPGKDRDWNARTDTYITVSLLKNVEIDAGNTLILEPSEVEYSGKEFALYAQLNNSDSETDIIINFKRK